MEETYTVSFASIAARLTVVFLLVLANGFFVASEFALVGARRSKIDQMAARGDRGAKVVQGALAHLDRYISGTQLGITVASLSLGWIGEPALAALLDHLFLLVGFPITSGEAHTAAAITTAFLIITFLHIVLGELAPKSLALLAPEAVSRWVAPPLILFSRIMAPFIAVLNGAANALLRLFGVPPMSEASRVHSPEELRLLVMQAREHGTLHEADSAMIAGVLDFHAKRARDVMRPRTELAALPIDAAEREVREMVRRVRYSRYPVHRSHSTTSSASSWRRTSSSTRRGPPSRSRHTFARRSTCPTLVRPSACWMTCGKHARRWPSSSTSSAARPAS